MAGSVGLPIEQIDPSLLKWATLHQKAIAAAVEEHGGFRAAERALGLAHGSISHAMAALRRRAAAGRRQEAIAPKGTDGFAVRELSTAYDADGEIRGMSVREGPEPENFEGEGDASQEGTDPYYIKGKSTLYGADGAVKVFWKKTAIDVKKREAVLREAAEAMAAEIPRAAALPAPAHVAAELCTVYTMTDCHIGMLAWHKEGGADWDLSIAERTLVGCFEQMVLASPASRMAVVNQLGDWMHYDGMVPVTPTANNPLDSEGRFSKMVGVAIRVLRRLIDVALLHHEEVRLQIAEGNHDIVSSIWLRQMFAALYENEPRLTVDGSELPYYCVQHGATMLAFHHGHLKKNDSLPLLFAAQFPKVWGATMHRYAHVGHWHHVEEKEHNGMIVTQHPTLAARDAYAARGGYIADRSATAITYHSKFGQVARNTVSPEMLET